MYEQVCDALTMENVTGTDLAGLINGVDDIPSIVMLVCVAVFALVSETLPFTARARANGVLHAIIIGVRAFSKGGGIDP
jgi:hypothetical protein